MQRICIMPIAIPSGCKYKIMHGMNGLLTHYHIYRFYKKNPELWSETTLKNKKRLFPVTHAKYFDSEIMFDENKILVQENRSMKNVIDCLMEKESLQARLWFMNWSYFVTVAYSHDRNKKSCYRIMNGLYDELVKKYGENAEVRIFFTTEQFTNRNGYHNHFVVYCSDKKLNEVIQNDIAEYFNGNRLTVEPYNRYEAGLFYMVKNGLVNEDWDILGNRLNEAAKAA
jgi:hypothetical protein